jgi:hypothetical protein
MELPKDKSNVQMSCIEFDDTLRLPANPEIFLVRECPQLIPDVTEIYNDQKRHDTPSCEFKAGPLSPSENELDMIVQSAIKEACFETREAIRMTKSLPAVPLKEDSLLEVKHLYDDALYSCDDYVPKRGTTDLTDDELPGYVQHVLGAVLKEEPNVCIPSVSAMVDKPDMSDAIAGVDVAESLEESTIEPETSLCHESSVSSNYTNISDIPTETIRDTPALYLYLNGHIL